MGRSGSGSGRDGPDRDRSRLPGHPRRPGGPILDGVIVPNRPTPDPRLRPGSRVLRRDIEDLLDDLGPLAPIRERIPGIGRPTTRPPNRRPTHRLPAGTVVQPIELPSRKLEALLRRSLTEEHERVVWAEAGDEVVVDLARTRVAIRTGLLMIAIVLHADGTEPTELVVPLAIGTPQDITALHAVTPRAPEGPAGLALRWGDAVIAAAWGALIDVVTEVAQAAGTDERGAPLQPAALVADDDVLGIVLQAEPERPGGDR